MNNTKERRNFKADFDRLVSDLKASPPASNDTISKPSNATTSKRPAMRFHEAEDAGDSRFVQQWDKAIDAMLAGTDGSEEIKSDSFEAIKEFIKLESTNASNLSAKIPEMQESKSNQQSTSSTTVATDSAEINVDSSETKNQLLENQLEATYDTDRGENDLLSTASTDREMVESNTSNEDGEEDDDEVEIKELDRMLDQVKVLKESLGTQDAVLLQVLQSGPSNKNQGKSYQLYSIAAICMLLLSILIAFKLSGS